MRDDLERLLGQTSLVVVALAIAIGWSLFQMAKGVADLVTGLFTRYPSSSDAAVAAHFQPATWVVGQRVVTFGSLIAGVVELAVALVVAGWIVRRGRTAQAPPQRDDFAEMLALHVRRQLKGFPNVLLHETEGVPLVELMVADDEVRVIHLGDEMRVTALLTAATAANSREVSLSASMNVWADDWDTHKPEGRSRRRPRGEALGATLYELSNGGGIAYHIHHGSEELLIVLEGRLKLRTWMSGNSEMNRP